VAERPVAFPPVRHEERTVVTAPFRRVLLDSIQHADNDVQGIVSDMKETVTVTREMIEASRAHMREVDRLLAQR
jgi:hypothetical protein